MKISQVLDNPYVWELGRICLDVSWGIYRKRIEKMKEWGILRKNISVIAK
jgi:hypothetical protein